MRHLTDKLTGTQARSSLGAQRARLSMLLGHLGEVPDTNPTERTIREEYHFRLPERGVTARPNIERTQHKRMKAA